LIFGSFTQADSSTTRKYGGSGLGLAICKSLVELMGGQIGVLSEVGCGSEFFFTVPRCLPENTRFSEGSDQSEAEGALQTQPPSSVTVLGQTAVQILIAEDSEDNLFLIQIYLKDSGFKVELVRNGKQAVESVMAGHYDLVLMDVQMPVMDGHTAVSAIRAWEKAHSLPETPIVALTAHAFKDVVEKSKTAGCTDHLTKPVQRRALLQAISRNLRPILPPLAQRSMNVAKQSRASNGAIAPPLATELPTEVRELVPGYVERRQNDMVALWMALKMADYRTLSALGHQLKGSGAAYGFEGLSDYGASLEEAAKASDLDEASRQTALIADYVAQLSNG
jgi:CheY-like chemotaxis protein